MVPPFYISQPKFSVNFSPLACRLELSVHDTHFVINELYQFSIKLSNYCYIILISVAKMGKGMKISTFIRSSSREYSTRRGE